jgi:hypothetical protein
MSDRLHDTLSSLRTDVDRTPLADSSAVRARGNQRTRRQAVGTSLAVVALVAGAVGIGGALIGGENNADQLPAPQPTAPTVTTSQTPEPEPTTQAPLDLDDRVLLGSEELPVFPNQPFSVGETLDPATGAEAEEYVMTACGGPPIVGDVAPATAIARTFFTDLDATMWHWVAQYATVAEAEEAVDSLRLVCDRDGFSTEDIEDTSDMPGVTQVFHASRFTGLPDPEFNGEVTGVVRLGDTISVVGLRGMFRESEVDLNAFDATVASAAQRLTTR